MILKLTLNLAGKQRPVSVETPLSENLTMADMKRLWETEQFLNGLPGTHLRVHVELRED